MPYRRCRFIALLVDSSAIGGCSLVHPYPLPSSPTCHPYPSTCHPPHLSSSPLVILSAAKDLSRQTEMLRFTQHDNVGLSSSPLIILPTCHPERSEGSLS